MHPTRPHQQQQKQKPFQPRFKIDPAASPMPKPDSQNASRPGRHQIGMVGKIISEPWARSNRYTRARSSESAPRKRFAQIFREVGERALERTSCRSRSSSAEVHALRLFIRLVAMSSGHARFRALDAAGSSFFASALAARSPLIGSSISFCPAAALRGFLPFAGSAPRSFAMLRFRASRRSVSGHPSGRLRFRTLAAPSMGLPLRFRLINWVSAAS